MMFAVPFVVSALTFVLMRTVPGGRSTARRSSPQRPFNDERKYLTTFVHNT
jgi:hypothetical protein